MLPHLYPAPDLLSSKRGGGVPAFGRSGVREPRSGAAGDRLVGFRGTRGPDTADGAAERPARRIGEVRGRVGIRRETDEHTVTRAPAAGRSAPSSASARRRATRPVEAGRQRGYPWRPPCCLPTRTGGPPEP